MASRPLLIAATALLAGGAAACSSTGALPSFTRASLEKSRCADESFPVYFARGSAELNEAARQVIGSASNRVAGCRISSVDVLGIAAPDSPGGATDAALTQSRADAVARALAAAGLPAPAFDVQVAGSTRPPMRPNRREPLPRRTEVVLHASPV